MTSYDDNLGMNIGINTFFEEFYHRPQFNSLIPNLQLNRYYSHIKELKIVKPCNNKYICFIDNYKSMKSENDEL